MARRRYFRYYPRRTVPKKKWASNLISETVSGATAQTRWATLVENKAQANAPTPTIIKCGNFKVQGDFYGNVNNPATNVFPNAVVYILFVPEGWTEADLANIPTQHPEWIMGWSRINADALPLSSTAITNASKFTISTRLKRNLNSGDKVIFLMSNPSSYLQSSSCSFTAQFWTCAN